MHIAAADVREEEEEEEEEGAAKLVTSAAGVAAMVSVLVYLWNPVYIRVASTPLLC